MFRKFSKKNFGIEFEQETIKKNNPKKLPNLKQLKYLPKFLTVNEKRKLKISFFFFSASLILLLTIFYFFHLEVRPAVGGEFFEGVVGESEKKAVLDRLVSTKFYKLEEEAPLFIILKREKNNQEGAFIEKITLKLYPDFKSAAIALQKKEIDALGFTPPKEIADPRSFSNLNFYSIPLPYFTAVFFNVKKDKLSAETREILSCLTPKEKIWREVLLGEGKIINGSACNKEEIERKLSQIKSPLEISLTTIEDPVLQKIAEIILESWEKAGITTKLVTIKTNEAKNVIREGSFEAILLGVLNKNSDPYPLWHSSQIEPGSNISKFSNRKADELLEKYKLAKDKTKREQYYDEFQKIINKEIPAIFLYSTNYNYLIDKKVKGVKIENLNSPEDRFNSIKDWYIKTKRGRKK